MYTYNYKHIIYLYIYITAIPYNTITTTELWVLNGKAEAEGFQNSFAKSISTHSVIFSFICS